MPPPIDSANRRRYKIIFPSQYLLYTHASKKIHTHRSDSRSWRKISDQLKAHLWHWRSIVYRRAKTLHPKNHALDPHLLLLPQLPLLLQPRLITSLLLLSSSNWASIWTYKIWTPMLQCEAKVPKKHRPTTETELTCFRAHWPQKSQAVGVWVGSSQ